MTECNKRILEFPVGKRRKVQASFTGGEVTSNGGVVLLHQVDRRLGLTERGSKVLRDDRRQASCEHIWSVASQIRLRAVSSSGE